MASGSTIRKRVFRRYALDQKNVTAFAGDIASIREQAYNLRLAQLGDAMRLGSAPTLTDEAILSAMQRDARSVAFGAVRSHNDALRTFVANQPADLTQAELSRAIRTWDAQYQQTHSGLIALNESRTALSRADRDVQQKNELAVKVRVVPDTAEEEKCSELIQRGWIPAGEVDFDFPVHVRCEHGFEYQDSLADLVADKSQVWAGGWIDTGDDVSLADKTYEDVANDTSNTDASSSGDSGGDSVDDSADSGGDDASSADDSASGDSASGDSTDDASASADDTTPVDTSAATPVSAPPTAVPIAVTRVKVTAALTAHQVHTPAGAHVGTVVTAKPVRAAAKPAHVSITPRGHVAPHPAVKPAIQHVAAHAAGAQHVPKPASNLVGVPRARAVDQTHHSAQHIVAPALRQQARQNRPGTVKPARAAQSSSPVRQPVPRAAQRSVSPAVQHLPHALQPQGGPAGPPHAVVQKPPAAAKAPSLKNAARSVGQRLQTLKSRATQRTAQKLKGITPFGRGAKQAAGVAHVQSARTVQSKAGGNRLEDAYRLDDIDIVPDDDPEDASPITPYGYFALPIFVRSHKLPRGRALSVHGQHGQHLGTVYSTSGKSLSVLADGSLATHRRAASGIRHIAAVSGIESRQ